MCFAVALNVPTNHLQPMLPKQCHASAEGPKLQRKPTLNLHDLVHEAKNGIWRLTAGVQQGVKILRVDQKERAQHRVISKDMRTPPQAEQKDQCQGESAIGGHVSQRHCNNNADVPM